MLTVVPMAVQSAVAQFHSYELKAENNSILCLHAKLADAKQTLNQQETAELCAPTKS